MNFHHSYHKWLGPINVSFRLIRTHELQVELLGSWIQILGYERVLKDWRIDEFPDI